jgi:hypothetical protein
MAKLPDERTQPLPGFWFFRTRGLFGLFRQHLFPVRLQRGGWKFVRLENQGLFRSHLSDHLDPFPMGGEHIGR